MTKTEKAKAFFVRHKKKFIAVGILAGTVVAGLLIKKQITEQLLLKDINLLELSENVTENAGELVEVVEETIT